MKTTIINFLQEKGISLETSEKLYDKITDFTNKDLNFEASSCSYDDIFSDDLIQEFLDKNLGKHETLQDSKDAFYDFVYEKFIFDYDFMYDYESYLASELEKITDFEIDGYDLIRDLEDEFGILGIDIDIKSYVNRNGYKIAINSIKDEDVISCDFYDGRYEDLSDDLKKYGSVLQKICNKNGFNLKSIFDYARKNKNNKSYRKSEKLYKNNRTFKSIYDEFINCFGYAENLYFIQYMDLDEILKLCVKDSDYEAGYRGSIGLYNDGLGSGSLFEIELKNPVKIKTSDLNIRLYNKTSIESCYGFTNSVFN